MSTLFRLKAAQLKHKNATKL